MARIPKEPKDFGLEYPSGLDEEMGAEVRLTTLRKELEMHQKQADAIQKQILNLEADAKRKGTLSQAYMKSYGTD